MNFFRREFQNYKQNYKKLGFHNSDNLLDIFTVRK
jgi:hypothetical protein